MTRPASGHQDELLDELRLLARTWRAFQKERREERQRWLAAGHKELADRLDAEAYTAGMFAGQLERLIQRFEGGGADRGA